MDIYIKVKKEDIAFVTTIIESFEGVAAVRVPNPKTSIIHAIVSDNCLEEFESVIRNLAKEIKYEIIISKRI